MDENERLPNDVSRKVLVVFFFLLFKLVQIVEWKEQLHNKSRKKIKNFLFKIIYKEKQKECLSSNINTRKILTHFLLKTNKARERKKQSYLQTESHHLQRWCPALAVPPPGCLLQLMLFSTVSVCYYCTVPLHNVHGICCQYWYPFLAVPSPNCVHLHLIRLSAMLVHYCYTSVPSTKFTQLFINVVALLFWLL